MLSAKARLIAAMVLAFTATLAIAEVPQETLERLAAIRVRYSELYHLRNIQKLSNDAYTQELTTLKVEEQTLWVALRQYPQSEQVSARSTVNGLANAQLSLLTQQWNKAVVEFRVAEAERKKQTTLSVEEDARKAVEFQRQRLLLQRQLKNGEIDQETFTQKDREALASIADLRKKYEPSGENWDAYFDNRLSALSQALADVPEAAIPKPDNQTAGEPDTATLKSQVPDDEPPDFDRDVKRAADILVQWQEMDIRFNVHQIPASVLHKNQPVYVADIDRLNKRYRAVSTARGQEFERAYKQMAAPAMQALLVKYYPDRYKTAPVQATASPQNAPPDDPFENLPLYLILGGLGLIGFIVFLVFRPRKYADPVPPLTQIHGTAEWAAWQQKPFTEMDIYRGVTFGRSSRPEVPPAAPGAPITSFPESHTLIVARTRAGKGTRVIVPTLLRYRGSMLVIDPKGENAAITARTRRDQLDQTVHIVNPWGEMKELYGRLGFTSATFNPLDAIDRDDPNAVAVAQTLAATICPVTNEKDKYWQGSAANVLAGVFLWIADHPGEQKTLARAREIVTLSRTDFQKILARMVTSTAFHGAVKEMVSQYIDLAPETYSGIMSNLAENTKFLSDPQIKAVTATSSFSLHTLRDVLTTVYLVIPHDRIQTHATWLRLVIASAMQAIKTRSRRTEQPHHRCMFLIDEFGSIGHIADIPRDIALMSGYGLDFTLIVQGLDQLKHHYREAAGTILSNCGYKWFCYVNELETAKYLSESLGKATVRTVGKSWSSGQNPGGASEGESTTFGETGRSLLTPDEILNLGRDIAILLNPHRFPYYLRPVDYWNLAETFAHLKTEYAHFYWDPPLTYDANPYAPGGHGSQNNSQNGSRASTSKNGMSADQAREILGVNTNATRDEIMTSFRRLMAKLHPDKGGSNFFAKQLNAAKAALLGE